MKNTRKQTPALARKADIVVQELTDETLVYDLNDHRVYCLNQVSTFVWNQCDGSSSVATITARLAEELGRPLDEDVTWLALKQLQEANLLQRHTGERGGKAIVSRREVMRRLGAATALALPVVISVVAPTAAAAASVPPECLVCTRFLPSPGSCPSVCNETVSGSCYGNNSCNGVGQNFTCHTCPDCIAHAIETMTTNNSWRAGQDGCV